MLIEHISVSRKNTYDTCSLHYKFKYHLKTPVNEPEKPHFVYGKIIHDIAEEYVKQKEQIPIGDIANEILKNRPLPPGYNGKFQDHLRALVSLTSKLGCEGELEYKFEYDLDPPNNKLIVGAIDRLIPQGDHWFIIDYKTTKKSNWWKNSDTIKFDIQLRAYAKVVQKEFNVPADKIVAGLYYLEGPTLIGTRFSEHALMETENQLLETYNIIEQSDADKVRGSVGRHCYNCPYKGVCPAFQNSNFKN